jgi:hypothetical protein
VPLRSMPVALSANAVAYQVQVSRVSVWIFFVVLRYGAKLSGMLGSHAKENDVLGCHAK